MYPKARFKANQLRDAGDLQSPPSEPPQKPSKDEEAAGIDVGWLRYVLDEIAEAIEPKKRCLEIEVMQELELQMEDLAEKAKALEAAKARVVETRARLSEPKQESSKLQETMLSIHSKADSIHYISLVAEIL
ncbi:hypothetical protein ACJRO7_015114 [Eucalyptus globulus]|uniref:Uncharacterized protein n=1 Tax=Eucalyptus globulus TaxID=34317 RepID=A0ABD3L6C6_EUCGL